MSSPTGPFDEGQVAQLQTELGTTLDYDDLAARYARLGNDLDAVITEVLRIRLANINTGPPVFAIPGSYSQDATAQQKALEARLGIQDGVAAALVRIAPSEFTRSCPTALDTEEALVRHRDRLRRHRR